MPQVLELAGRSRVAAARIRTASRSAKDAALHAMADRLLAARADVLAANAADVARAEDGDTAPALIDRLRLDQQRVAAMADGLRDLAGLPDPVGEVTRGWTKADGVRVRQVRVPFGVVGIIYESRPNVTADAAGICVKSGNAVLLRGSSSAEASNTAIVAALRDGLVDAGLPADAVQLLPGDRSVTAELMTARGSVDVLIPRGGAGLIEAVVTGSTVPVIETGVGNCHLYLDATADPAMAVDILINAKVQRPSVCNAVETLLVHADALERLGPPVLAALAEHRVWVHADQRLLDFADRATGSGVLPELVPATEEDWDTEYLSLDLAVAVVDDLDAAVDHIRRHGTGHSETIVTGSLSAADAFVAAVDAAAVLVNASSRFVDGGEFGFGAEIGISTQKLHARGPMGLPEMTTTTYVVTGDGQIR